MSNLLKGSYIKDKGQRIIDYNDLISNRLEKLKKQAQEGSVDSVFMDGISPSMVESLIGTEEDATAATMEPLSVEVIQEQQQEVEALKEHAETIVRNAQEEADGILQEARIGAAQIKAEAAKQGHDEGYQKGFEQAEQDGEARCAEKLKELEDDRLRLEEEYQELKAQLEPQIVDKVLSVIEKVTGIVYENNKDILLHLINQVLADIEESGEYVIKVSHEDYDFVLGKQSRLYNASAKDMNIEIVEDRSLKAGKCLIETDGGIFDCSLDVQMDQLVKDMRLLAGM